LAKKLFIISSVLLLLALVFLGIYNFAFREKKPPVSDSSNTNIDPLEEPKKEEGEQEKETAENQLAKIRALTEEAVIAPSLSPDGESIVYYSKGGKVYQISFSGTKEQTISETELPGLIDIIWSPKKDKVISVLNRDGVTSRYYYDYNAKVGVRLDSKMEQINWTNLGNQIIYKFSDPRTGEISLSLADPDGKNWKNVARIPWKNTKIKAIPQSSLLAFWNSPDSFEETQLLTVSLAGGKSKMILTQRFGADYLWSPDGQKILVSSSETRGGSKMSLALANGNGGEYQNLNIPTLVSKCVWSADNKTLYYALPGSIPEGSVMPNDYSEKKFTSKDTFWKIDTATGRQERLLETDEIIGVFDAAGLFLSPTENKLFFVNRIDGRLYAIDI
jgi:Tol biopolymer transport system component